MYKKSFFQSEEYLQVFYPNAIHKIIDGNEIIISRKDARTVYINAVANEGLPINDDNYFQVMDEYGAKKVIVERTYDSTKRINDIVEEYSGNWILDLETFKNYDTYISRLGKKTRQHIKNYRRRLEKYCEENKVDFSCKVISPIDNSLDEYKKEYLAVLSLIEKRFENEASVRNENSIVLSKIGYIYEYLFHDRLVAAAVFYVYDNQLYLQNLTCDYNFSKLNLGNLVLVDSIRWAFDNKIGKYNMLWGDAEYKKQFAAVKHYLYNHHIYKKRFTYYLASVFFFIKRINGKIRLSLKRKMLSVFGKEKIISVKRCLRKWLRSVNRVA